MFANKRGSNMESVCPQCGSKFSYSIQYCEKCGYNLEKDKALHEQAQKSSSNQVSSSYALNNKYQGFIQIIAVIEVAFGLFATFIGLLLAIVAPFVPDIVKSSNTGSDAVQYSAQFLQFLSIMVFVLAVMILLVAGASIFFGYKLYRLENIGRFGSMVIASFALLGVPFGTIFGIISLVLLTRPETIVMFRERNRYV